MTTVRVGPFILDNPPSGQESMVRSVLASCDYPWPRVMPALRGDANGAVVVKWQQLSQAFTGQFFPSSYEIHISTRYDGWWQQQSPHTFAHECGHLVDTATLNTPERAQLLTILHTSEPTIGQFNHDSPEMAHNEQWINLSTVPHMARINEAYAEAWVAAFVPSVFLNVGYIHWPSNLQDIRQVTLQREINVFTDVPESNVHHDAIEWAATNGYVNGYPDGTFKPNDPVSRAGICTILNRYHLDNS